MSKIKTTLISLALIIAISSTTFANGLSLNSVGARALGMGGAFVGVANDATALYWNPAGLAGQQSSILVFGTDIIPMATYKMDLAGIDAKTNTNHYISPNAFFNYNMGDLSVGLGVYVPAGLGAEWNATDFGYPEGYDFLSKIGVVNISPAVAYQVTDQFSVGLAVNVYYAMFDLSQPIMTSATTAVQFEETSTGLGYGATLGLKYELNDMFTFGATFRTKTNVTMSGTAKNPAFAFYSAPTESEFDRDVAWPTWIAGGVAIRPNDKLTIAVDGQLSMWSENQELKAVYTDAKWEGIMSGNGGDTFELSWKDALQIRLGLEYVVSDDVVIRGGYYYDPAPAPDETVNVLFPSSTNNVVTGGLSYKMGQMCFTGAAEYLLGAERDIEMVAENAMPGVHQMDVFAFSLGFTYFLK
jgi:long-chain fatty acid transport protein